MWLALSADEAYLTNWTLFATLVGTTALAGAVLLRRPAAIPFAVAVVVLPYVGILTLERENLDTSVPLLAALLFGATELAYWSLELRGNLEDESGTYLRRLALTTAFVVGMFAAGTAVLAVVEGFTTRGATFDVLGAAGALVVVGLLALAAAARRAA